MSESLEVSQQESYREKIGLTILRCKGVLTLTNFWRRFERVYLYGYSLREAIFAELFARLSQWRHSLNHGGYCYETAALVMFALRGVRTARLCYGVDDAGRDHGWVECRHLGTWWVIDLVWAAIENNILPRKDYRAFQTLRYEKIVDYQEFWHGPHAERLAEILANPEHVGQTDVLTYLAVFRPGSGYGLKPLPYVDQPDGWRVFPNGHKVPRCALLDNRGIGTPDNIERLMTDATFHPTKWNLVDVTTGQIVQEMPLPTR